MRNTLQQIGQLAKAAGVNIQTIRYYERRGILKPTEKRDSGYRLYGADAVKTVKFIKHAQELGFSLEEIRDLMRLRAPSTGRCEGVRIRASKKLTDVQEKIAMLQGIEVTLKKLIKDCEDNKTSQKCPIIDSMEEVLV
jgi:MerR family transcriptional regulator, copper efflux regulator